MINCNVARDLLPLYHDGVCSEDSRKLVEEHVASCPGCSEILRELRGEIEIPHESPDDLGTMKKIEKTVRRGKKRAWMKGASAVLAVMFVIFAGVNIWWYADIYCYYQQFVRGHETDQWGTASIMQTAYMWDSPGCEFVVAVPGYLGTNGSVQVSTTLENSTRTVRVGEDVNVILNIGRECYDVVLSITEHSQAPGQAQLQVTHTSERLLLDRDLNPVDGDEPTMQLLEKYGEDIRLVIREAQAQWPFLMG